MKNSIRHFIYVFVSFLILLFLLYFTSNIFMRDDACERYENFKKSKTDYDVLFFGSSHVLNAIFPMQLWNDYGITSYNLAWHGMTVIPSYWILQTSVSYHKPKIAVLDILGINNDSKDISYPYFHGFYDNFPISKTKISAINDLCYSHKMKLEFYVPFYSYHSRWQERHFISDLKSRIKWILGGYSSHDVTKGAELRIGVKMNTTFDMSVNKYEGKESVGIEYARKFINYCRQNEIEPVFMFIPYSEQKNLYEWRDALISILEKENVSFIDLTNEIVDFEIDQFDQNSHLNPSGAKKVTEVVGRKLVQNFSLNSHKSDVFFSSWKQDYEDYREYIFEKISTQSSFKNLLMMLNNSEVYANVCARDNISFTETEQKLIFENRSRINFLTDNNIDYDVKIEVFSIETNDLICERNFSVDKVIIQ